MIEYSFIFILMGTKPVKREVAGGVRLRQTCPVCGVLSELRECQVRNYFTLFFIPVFPLGKGASMMSCSRCQSAFSLPAPAAMPDADLETELDAAYEIEAAKQTFICAACKGRLRVPRLEGKTIPVTCPHCKTRFRLSDEGM